MLQGSVSTTVHATPDHIWRLLTEKIESAELSIPQPSEITILERTADYVLRERVVEGDRIVERITVDNSSKKIVYTLVGHPSYEGYISHQLLRSDNTTALGCILAFAIDWRVVNGEDPSTLPDLLEVTNDDLFNMRDAIERTVEEEEQRQLALAKLEAETQSPEEPESPAEEGQPLEQPAAPAEVPVQAQETTPSNDGHGKGGSHAGRKKSEKKR